MQPTVRGQCEELNEFRADSPLEGLDSDDSAPDDDLERAQQPDSGVLTHARDRTVVSRALLR